MALSFDEIWVYGGQLVVAKPLTNPKALGEGLTKIDWSAYIQGSLQVGAVDDFGEGDYPGTATVMVGRTDTKSTPLSINTRGNVRIEGDLSPVARHKLLEDYGGAYENFKVVESTFSQRARRGVASVPPMDANSQDVSVLIGSEDISKLDLYPADDPRDLSLNRAFNGGNCGLACYAVQIPFTPSSEPKWLILQPSNRILILSNSKVVYPSPPIDADESIYLCRFNQRSICLLYTSPSPRDS